MLELISVNEVSKNLFTVVNRKDSYLRSAVQVPIFIPEGQNSVSNQYLGTCCNLIFGNVCGFIFMNVINTKRR